MSDIEKKLAELKDVSDELKAAADRRREEERRFAERAAAEEARRVERHEFDRRQAEAYVRDVAARAAWNAADLALRAKILEQIERQTISMESHAAFAKERNDLLRDSNVLGREHTAKSLALTKD